MVASMASLGLGPWAQAWDLVGPWAQTGPGLGPWARAWDLEGPWAQTGHGPGGPLGPDRARARDQAPEAQERGPCQ